MVTTIHTIPMGFDQCYLLQGEGCVLVDAGAPGHAGVLKGALDRLRIRPERVGLVVITHGHWDHMGSARAIKGLTGARIAMHRHDARWLEGGEKRLPPGITSWGRWLMRFHRVFLPLIRIPGVEVDILLDDEGMDLAPYGVPGRVVHTPGHTPGSVSVLLDSGEAFVGDLLMNRMPLRRTPGLGILGEDADLMKDSLLKLAALGAKVLYPAHGNSFEWKHMNYAPVKNGDREQKPDV